MMTPIARAALTYMGCGWAPTPVKPYSKAPLLAGWPRRRLGEADLHLFSAGRNVGLVLGRDGGGLVDVDCDWPEAAALAFDLLPPTDLVHGRPGSPHSHFWYRSEAASAVFALEGRLGSRKRVVVELRSAGHMTVVPPSTHPSGDVLAWARHGEPANASASDLRHAVARLATGALLVAIGWSTTEAIAFARRPTTSALDEIEQRHGTALPLRVWLRNAPRPVRPCSPRTPPTVIPGRASPLTEAVLTRLGSVDAAARLLGLRLREGRQACPFHKDSGSRSLEVTGPVWRCWAGCGSGNAIHLASRALSLSYVEARSWLAERLGVCTPRGRSVPCGPYGDRRNGTRNPRSPRSR